MFVNVRIYVRTPQKDQESGIVAFSRVPCIGEMIQAPFGRFRVLDVTHLAVGGGSANNLIATILVQPN